MQALIKPLNTTIDRIFNTTVPVHYKYSVFLSCLFFALLIVCFFHLSLGAKNIPWELAWQALTMPDYTNPDQNIILTIRIPRLYVALIAGGALAIAGVLIQAISHNPLADPGILGINSGAAFFVVIGSVFFSTNSSIYLALSAFLGALFAAGLVFLLSGKNRGAERLILSGVAITALFSAMTAIVLLVDQQGLEKLRHWLTGSIGASDAKKILWVWPYLLVGGIGAIVLTRSLNAYHLGEKVANSLGVNIKRLKIITILSIVLLSGSVVALAGPIGFVGLVVPHMARLFVKNNYLWLLPFALVCGALLLVSADLVARIIIDPYEINTGIVTALIGAPVFIALVIGRLR